MICRVQASPATHPDLSPTEVQDWMLCPTYWYWRHGERWLPKTVGPNEIQAWIGRAVHAGIAAWCLHEPPLPAASLAYNHSVEAAVTLGREWEEKDAYLRSAHAALELFTAQAPSWLQTACRGVEVALGRARLDWIGKPEGVWRVVDFKTKKKRPFNLEAYQWELRRSWQFADYVERASTSPDSPAYGGAVRQMQVQTIVLGDEGEVLTDTFTPSPIQGPERRALEWLLGGYGPAGPLAGLPPWRNRSKCRNWFGGDCPYLRACWDYEGDETRMTVDYVKTGAPHDVAT